MITFKKSAMKYKDSSGNMQDSGVLFGKSETDSTLTKSGVAADAKITGERLDALTGEIEQLQALLVDGNEVAY